MNFDLKTKIKRDDLKDAFHLGYDIDTYDGIPLLSLYNKRIKNSQDRDFYFWYNFLHQDTKSKIYFYLFFSVEKPFINLYLENKVALRHLMLMAKEHFLEEIFIQGNEFSEIWIQEKKLFQINFSEIPNEYLPNPDSFYK